MIEIIKAKIKQKIKEFHKKLTINKKWLEKHFKMKFSQRKSNSFDIHQLDYVIQGLEEFFDNCNKYLDDLELLSDREENDKSRRSEKASVISKIYSKNILFFIKDFIEYLNHKEQDISHLDFKIKKFEESIEWARKEYLSAQSAGILLAHSSMNYYTVNKKPKDFVKELEYLEEKKKVISSEYKQEKNNFEIKEKYTLRLGNKENQWFKDYCQEKKKTQFTLEDTYILMKVFKANMKSLFLENIRKYSIDQIKKDFTLFNEDEHIKSVIKFTNQELYKERGELFIKKKVFDKIKRKKTYNKHFVKWCEFIEFYKEIAIANGKIKAQIKGIEREKTEAENMKYWSFIVEENANKYLWLVPKDNMQEFKEELGSNGRQEGENTLYSMKSLTKRALHKLCFAEESSFVKEMPEELRLKQKKVKEATNDKKKLQKERKKNSNYKDKSELELEFLKIILKSDYARERLDIRDFKLDKVYQSNNNDDFEIELEKACYIRNRIYISTDKKEEYIRRYQILVFEITSYDIENRNKNTYQTKGSEYKNQTKEIWDQFWMNDNSNIRINPEIKIFFREKNEEVENNLKRMGMDLKKIKHRGLQDQYTVQFTFNLNAGKMHPQLGFCKTEDLIKEINAFNEDLNQRNWNQTYKYGIDRGNIELATLCIAKFNDTDTYNVNGNTKLKPTFPNSDQDIKCYELNRKLYDKYEKPSDKILNYLEIKKRRVIANLSYFIDRIDDSYDKEKWFDERNITTIDLTTAKVIKGKIILNGDILTFLKLKKACAKKKIFEIVTQNQFSSKLSWCKDEGKEKCLMIDDKEVYWFDDRFEGLLLDKTLKYTKAGIEGSLQSYYKDVDGKHKVTEDKINHLKECPCSQYDRGYQFFTKKIPWIYYIGRFE